MATNKGEETLHRHWGVVTYPDGRPSVPSPASDDIPERQLDQRARFSSRRLELDLTTLPDNRKPQAPGTRCEPLIDVEAAATILKLHPKTVKKLAQQGRLPAFKIGRKAWRFRESTLDAWVRSKLM